MHQDTGERTPQEAEPDLAVSIQESAAEAWVGGGLCRAGGTECSNACMALLEEVAIIFITSHHSLAPGK